MDAPTGAAARLLWIADQIGRFGRPLEDVASELGTDVQSIRIALARHGLNRPLFAVSTSASRPQEALSEPVALQPPVADQRRMFARLQEPRCALLLAELAATAEYNAEGTRGGLVRAVRGFANTDGKDDSYRALIRIAAEALRWASMLQGGSDGRSMARYGDTEADGSSPGPGAHGAEDESGHGVEADRLQVLQT